MKFAHMADLHLGATSDPRLRELELKTLERAFDRCVEEGVDFVVVAGDLFHVNVPDLAVVRDSVRIFVKFVATGRRIYVVYGSHDFSPNAASIIDILDEAGVIVRVGRPSSVEGRLRPGVVKDERSGALLTGISGRRASLEREAFENLDREYLSSLEGFKIFVFHTGLDEVRRENERFEGIASTDLPRGFDYYAGGHIHRRVEVVKGARVVYPGPLFTGWGADMEATVKGERRGFYIVEGGREVRTRFVDLTAFEGVYEEIDATGLSSSSVNERLKALVQRLDARDKVLVVKVFGELASGRTSEVDFASFRDALTRKGAIYLHLSRNQLRAREVAAVTVGGEESSEIEERVLKELAGTVRLKEPRLREGSVTLAKDLLAQLRVAKREGETEGDYEARTSSAAVEVLGIKRLMEG
ncbi:MAG: exonuclease SbcCD subunit D [Candidatus Verstraetearchaeota archaeon]|nr:exonuclease SbcCD subunit D [Candidatus Verstraetearchaeota archaeon]